MDPFPHLVPLAPDYAHLPISLAFDWAPAGASLGEGECYLVIFRSIRRTDADDALLTAYDELAHAEAAMSPGFIHYFKGPLGSDGSCLSFCLWKSREDARAASMGPMHRQAAGLVGEMYASYELEFSLVSINGVGHVDFTPYVAVTR